MRNPVRIGHALLFMLYMLTTLPPKDIWSLTWADIEDIQGLADDATTHKNSKAKCRRLRLSAEAIATVNALAYHAKEMLQGEYNSSSQISTSSYHAFLKAFNKAFYVTTLEGLVNLKS